MADGVFHFGSGQHTSEQTFELQALDVAFGDILCDEGAFRWVIITDEYGRDPTVRWKSTETNINALTIISKRVEAGRPIIISEMLDWCHRTALAKDRSAE